MTSKQDAEDWFGIILIFGLGGAILYGAYNYYFVDEEESPPPIQTTPTAPVGKLRPIGMHEIGKATNQSVWRLNADTVKGSRDARLGWVVVDHSQNTETSARETKTLYRVDCTTTGAETLSTVDYAPDRSVVGDSGVTPEGGVPQFYPPGSLGFGVVEALCAEHFDE